MALIHFTTEEVREKISRAVPIYEPRVQAEIEDREKRYRDHRTRYEKQQDQYDADLAEWEAKKEATIKEKVEQELLDQNSFWWWQHKRTRAEIEDSVRRTTFFVGRPHYPIYGMFLWPRFEKSLAERSLNFCLQLREKLDNHDPERLVGLTPAELEMIEPDENTSDMGAVAEQ